MVDYLSREDIERASQRVEELMRAVCASSSEEMQRLVRYRHVASWRDRRLNKDHTEYREAIGIPVEGVPWTGDVHIIMPTHQAPIRVVTRATSFFTKKIYLRDYSVYDFVHNDVIGSNWMPHESARSNLKRIDDILRKLLPDEHPQRTRPVTVLGAEM